MKEGFTIYDNSPKIPDKKYSLRYLIITNIFSFFIGLGFHYLV